MDVVTLQEARAKGLTEYFTGQPCKHGHICRRVTASRGCKECQRLRSQEPERKAKTKVRSDEWVKANPDKTKAKRARYHLKNGEKERQRCVEWKAQNKEKISAYNQEYSKNNPEQAAIRHARRRAAIARFELTKDEKDTVKHIYWARSQLVKFDGAKRHVDHIVPLRGKTVCGLHVPWNLQILTQEENIKKRNKLSCPQTL